MKEAFVIFMLAYFALGNLILPMGDFSVLPDLPSMYTHCKATEHHDMNPFDFITDHLVNIDGFFDAHGNGDEQKPHHPFPFHHWPVQNLYFPPLPDLQAIKYLPTYFEERIPFAPDDTWFGAEHLARVFRPPISA